MSKEKTGRKGEKKQKPDSYCQKLEATFCLSEGEWVKSIQTIE
jgi:hypothetical protein